MKSQQNAVVPLKKSVSTTVSYTHLDVYKRQRTIQRREKVHPAHYLGKGKIEELKMMINTYDATGIVCDDELSPAQLKNLEKMLETKVMDRTIVILDIFAGRAISGEGKIQVELAQLKYRMSRPVSYTHLGVWSEAYRRGSGNHPAESGIRFRGCLLCTAVP